MARFPLGVWSYEARALKPSPEAYRYAERRVHAPPEEICFVDDAEQHVAAAVAAGWDAVRFTDAEALATALGERGLLRDD